jgi:hypothetical protein
LKRLRHDPTISKLRQGFVQGLKIEIKNNEPSRKLQLFVPNATAEEEFRI